MAQLRRWKELAEARAQREHEGTSRPKQQRRTQIHINVAAPSENVYPSKIVFRCPRGAPIYSHGTYLFCVEQLWFVNEPERGGPVARSLTATLDFMDMNGRSLFSQISGEWAIANARDSVGFDDTLETLPELPPVGEIAKLFVWQKRRDDATAYAWSRGARHYPGRRHPAHQIPPGDYQLEVRVRGIYVDQTFVFRLRNPGAGADPQILGLNSPEFDRQ